MFSKKTTRLRNVHFFKTKLLQHETMRRSDTKTENHARVAFKCWSDVERITTHSRTMEKRQTSTRHDLFEGTEDRTTGIFHPGSIDHCVHYKFLSRELQGGFPCRLVRLYAAALSCRGAPPFSLRPLGPRAAPLPFFPFSPSISLRLETAAWRVHSIHWNIGTPFSADGPARTGKRCSRVANDREPLPNMAAFVGKSGLCLAKINIPDERFNRRIDNRRIKPRLSRSTVAHYSSESMGINHRFFIEPRGVGETAPAAPAGIHVEGCRAKHSADRCSTSRREKSSRQTAGGICQAMAFAVVIEATLIRNNVTVTSGSRRIDAPRFSRAFRGRDFSKTPGRRATRRGIVGGFALSEIGVQLSIKVEHAYARLVERQVVSAAPLNKEEKGGKKRNWYLPSGHCVFVRVAVPLK